MKNLNITLSNEVEELITEHDVLNMLKASGRRVYADSLHVDAEYLKVLLAEAREAEAKRNRLYIQVWDIAWSKLK